MSLAAGAAELGEPRINSYIGQPLVADIELTALASPATAVQARLANPNVYRGANIGMPHVLSTLTMIVTRQGERQFLHVTSSAPVESSHVHLYLELADGGGRDVRLATLWMAPNPAPPAPVPVPVPVATPTPAPAPVVVAAPVKSVPPKPPRVVLARPVPKKVEPPAPAPVAVPLPVAVAAAPAACPAPAEVESSPVCAALDYKNTQLRAQIGDLEGKVRVLQVAMGASPSAVGPAPLKPHTARKRPPPVPESGMPWGWIAGAGAAVFVFIGIVLALLRRRTQPGVPGVFSMSRVRQRFARKAKVTAPVEPQM